MITIEPPSTTSVSAHNSGTPHLDSERCASLEGRPSSSRRTRTLTLVCVILLATTLHAQSPNWQLTWSDEFNGSQRLPPDPAKWSFVTGGNGFGNNELETYTSRPANAQQQNGNLVITAQKEDYTGPDGIPATTPPPASTPKTLLPELRPLRSPHPAPHGQGHLARLLAPRRRHRNNRLARLRRDRHPRNHRRARHHLQHSARPRLQRRQRYLSQIPPPAGEAVNTPSISTPSSGHRTTSSSSSTITSSPQRTPADLPPNTKWVYDHPFYILLNLAVGGRLARQPRRHHHLPPSRCSSIMSASTPENP